MPSEYIVIDTNAIINLYVAAGGPSGWDALSHFNREVIVLSFILDEELKSAIDGSIERGQLGVNSNTLDQFKEWVRQNDFVTKINYSPDDLDLKYRGADGRLSDNAGDRLIKEFVENTTLLSADERMQVGISETDSFRILTDDAGFAKDVMYTGGPASRALTPDELRAKGYYDVPYATTHFWAMRVYNQDISRDEYKSFMQTLQASGHGLSGGSPDGRGGMVHNVKGAILSETDLDNIDFALPQRLNFLKDGSGAIDVDHLIKGSILTGAIGLAAKYGIIDDVLSFAATMTEAVDLRLAGKESEANELLVRYAFETGGGGLGMILDLDLDGIETIDINDADVWFDLDGDLFAEKTGWLKGDDGFLVRDLNRDGKITDVGEMFGGPGQSGLSDLAQYDANSDGKITAADAIYAELKVWRDRDGDGVTDAGEMISLAALGIVEISVQGTALNVTTPQGSSWRTAQARWPQ